MSIPVQSTSTLGPNDDQRGQRSGRRYRPRQPKSSAQTNAESTDVTENAGPSQRDVELHPRRPQRPRQPRLPGTQGFGSIDGQARQSGQGHIVHGGDKHLGEVSDNSRRLRTHTKRPKDGDQATTSSGASTPARAPSGEVLSRQQRKPHRHGRAAKFNANLTDGSQRSIPKGGPVESKPSERYRSSAPKADDLTSILTNALKTSPYPDCPICFSAIHPAQPTWSCSPLIPISSATDDEKDGNETKWMAETARCCWTTFHLKCIRSWASKSVKDVADAWRARGEERKGEWRCPGCQSKRMIVPSGYWCFCGSTQDPKPPRLATPHSCANPCSRHRTCGHPCSLACHPGPCPPCQITIELPCYCGRHTLSFRCSHLYPGRAGQSSSADLSCGERCHKKLACGNHECEELCHDGDCKPCPVKALAKCYCGKQEKELGCGEGVEKTSTVSCDNEVHTWVGGFACENVCDRPFDCGIHRCSKTCHSLSLDPSPCPCSPSLVSHCPCGKHILSPASASAFPRGTNLVRTSCTDPIPTCESTCMKPLNGCSHPCSVRCHTGPCPPCSIMLVRPCRCGATTRDVKCSEEQARLRAKEAGQTGDNLEILCDRPCGALRACGRHQCNRVCCPLASLASVSKGKGKKKAVGVRSFVDVGDIVDEAGWHECELACGRILSCGNHPCEERDHRGPCPPCLRSSFDEMICHCGRTVLEPPILCGTRINCTYPCSRPPLPCGHPKAQHACHEDPTPCPPCPFLTSKRCACGKKMVGNVRCSQEKVSCGTTCGKLLACGFHHCERLCHGDSCGPCNAVCGKPRKLCLPANHPCTLPCHAPAACSENEPCHAITNITCPCGRIRQPIPCGRSTSNLAGREGSQQLKCTNECLVAKRNAKLAEALGINTGGDGRHQQVTYHDDLISFARANLKFCMTVEKSFADFVSSDKRSQILPQMPEARRKFVHDLASVYRMDTQMIDQEPHRSVQLIRRIDSRIPSPLLSSTVASTSASHAGAGLGLGKLADLRSPAFQSSSRPKVPTPNRSQTTTPTPAVGGSRGWTSVVARKQPSPKPDTDPTAWLTGGRSSPRVAQSSTSYPAIHSRPIHAPTAIPPSMPPAPDSEDVPDNWEDDA